MSVHKLVAWLCTARGTRGVAVIVVSRCGIGRLDHFGGTSYYIFFVFKRKLKVRKGVFYILNQVWKRLA